MSVLEASQEEEAPWHTTTPTMAGRVFRRHGMHAFDWPNDLGS